MKSNILYAICIFLVSCTPGQNTSDKGDGGIVTPPSCSTPCVFGITPGITDTIEGTNAIKTPMSTAIHIDDAIGDGGFISLKPCGPPCFLGITPDITSYDDAIKLIDTQKNIYGKCYDYDNRISGGVYGKICNNRIGVSFTDNIVGKIGFSLLENITIQQVIDAYGPPILIDVFVVSEPDQPSESVAILYYDQFQAYLAMAHQNGTEYMISSSTTITYISYLSKDRYKQEQSYSESTGGVPWKGYGVYEAELP